MKKSSQRQRYRSIAAENSQEDQATQTEDDLATIYMSRSIWEAYLSGQHTDLKITCQGKVFKVHKVVICSQSSVFAAMCNGKFKEGIESNVNLPEDEVDILERLIEYIYTGSYRSGREWIRQGQRNPKPINHRCSELHAKVYAIADKYHLPSLSELAAEQFQLAITPDPDEVKNLTKDISINYYLDLYELSLRSAKFVYQLTPSSNRELREHVKLAVMGYHHVVFHHGGIEAFAALKGLEMEVLAENAELAWDLMHEYRDRDEKEGLPRILAA